MSGNGGAGRGYLGRPPAEPPALGGAARPGGPHQRGDGEGNTTHNTTVSCGPDLYFVLFVFLFFSVTLIDRNMFCS